MLSPLFKDGIVGSDKRLSERFLAVCIRLVFERLQDGALGNRCGYFSTLVTSHSVDDHGQNSLVVPQGLANKNVLIVLTLFAHVRLSGIV